MDRQADGRRARRSALSGLLFLVGVPLVAQQPQTVDTPVAPSATPAETGSPAPQAIRARRPIEAIPETTHLGPAEIVFVHPLFRTLDEPPALVERLAPQDLETRVPLVVAVRLSESGKVLEAATVEPRLKALTAPLPALVPRWRFVPAKKGGNPVLTWATYAIDLNVSLEKAVFTAFVLQPVGKDDPLPAVFKEASGDEWMARYPKEITPAEPGAVSIEETDVLPAPEKTPWNFDAARVHSRVTALLEVSASGTVSRMLPTGDVEPLVVTWLRQTAARWRLTPGKVGGKPVDCWMTLDATLEYTVDSAKKKAERSIKKNLRGTPAA